MNGSIQIARVMGIPIVINVSWLITLAFVTSLLALRVYPDLIPKDSPYRDDDLLHWVMALVSGVAFFVSIILHELAHSFVARRQGIEVRNITLFVFGGVSQIAGEARRPLHEFVMAIVGPLTSFLIAVFFFAVLTLAGADRDQPYTIVLEWLAYMNLVLAVFNMAPGFPMDGGRVLRAAIWGLTGQLLRATRYATLLSRGLGYAMMALGALTFTGIIDYFEPLSGLWFVILGMFLEYSARQSWYQARALDVLAHYRAEDLMSPELMTARVDDEVRQLAARGGRRFIFFAVDDQDGVAGIVTDKETGRAGLDQRTPVGQLMVKTADAEVATPQEDGATLFQRMESSSLWHLPVVSDGRVLGVISREALIRLFARSLSTTTGLAGGRG